MKDWLRNIFKDKKGMGTVEVILIIVEIFIINIVIIKMMNFLIKHPVGCFFIWLYNKENRRKKECYTKN